MDAGLSLYIGIVKGKDMSKRYASKKKRVRFKPRFFVIVAVTLLLVFLLIFKLAGSSPQTPKTSDSEKKKEVPVTETEGKKVELNVTFAGDLVIHQPVFEAMSTGNGFDFTPCFKYVKKYIEPADAAICTFEGSLVGSNFTGYPMFRTPKKLAKDIKAVGFDLMTVTSNHAVDAGTAGFDSTLKATKNAGLIPSGGQLKDDDPDYAMIEAKDGVKIAFISYSYNDGTPENPALNGNPLPPDMVKRCNTFSMADKKGAVADAARIEKEARKAGADLVLISMHWGEEYQLHSNEDQQKLAQMLVDGTTCDVIVGSHPHVVQEYRTLKSKDGKRKVPCYFAIGNLLTNQRRELMGGDIHPEEGVIVMFKIKYDTGKKKVESIDQTRIPYWVNLYYGDRTHYDIVPLVGDYKNNESLVNSGNAGLAKEAKLEIVRILHQDEKPGSQ